MPSEIWKIVAWSIPLSIALLFFLIVFIFIFRKSISTYIESARINAGGFKISRAERALVEETVEASKEIFKEEVKNEVHQALKSSLYYGAYLPNTEAYSQASDWIVQFLKDNLSKEIIVDIKMTVVGMAYSWNDFLVKIPFWLKENDRCHINVNVLLVDPNYIDHELPISKTPRNWAEESRRRIADIRNLIECLSPPLRKRISSTFRTYKSIPQYHGILINEQELFLGRTDWEFDDDFQKFPKLTVGENRYRYFNRYTNEGHDRGAERVGLFLHWHMWYWSYFSEPVLSFKDGVEEIISED